MKRAFILMILFSAAIAFAQSPTADKPLTPFEQTLTSAENAFIAAAKKGDTAFLNRTLTADFTYVGADGQLAERQDFIDDLSDGGVDMLAYDMKIIPVAEGVAIVTYDAVVRVPPAEDQGPPPRYQHFSTTWVKQGDTWKMKFQQKTPTHWGDW